VGTLPWRTTKQHTIFTAAHPLSTQCPCHMATAHVCHHLPADSDDPQQLCVSPIALKVRQALKQQAWALACHICFSSTRRTT